jgi:hypothetical protein
MKKWMIASILLSVFFIILILYLTIKPEDISKISQIKFRFEFFILAIALNFLSYCFWGARIKVLSNACEDSVKISWWESTKIVMANLFLAGITPSMAGGEPVRIYLLNKDGMSLGSATASVLGERLIDAIFLLICVPFALFVFRNKVTDPTVSLGVSIGIIIFLIVIFLFFYAIKRPEKIKNLLIWLNKKFSRFSKKQEKESKIVNRISREVDNFHISMMTFFKNNRRAFLKASVLTVIQWGCAWLIPSAILMGLGLDPFIIPSIAAQVFLIIIIMMPTTPGSTGVTELGVSGLYSVVINSPAHILGVFVLLFRFITYHMNLVVGAIFQYRIFKSVASFSMDMIRKEEEKED